MAARDAVVVIREDGRLGVISVCICSVKGGAGGSRRMDSGMRSASTSKSVALSQGLGGMALLLPRLLTEDDCPAILGDDEEA